MLAFLTVLYLNLFLLDFYLFVLTLTQTYRKKTFYLSLGFMLIAFVVLYGLTLEISLTANHGIIVQFASFIRTISVEFYILVFVFILIVSLYILHYENKYWGNTITKSSIKESIDNLPMGLCFSLDNGVVLLSNKVMNSLSYHITGRELQNSEALWEAIKTKQIASTIQIDDKTWSFLRKPIMIDQHKGIQISAINVTELEELRKELKSKNGEYLNMNQRLTQYSDSLTSIKAIEERLSTKTRLHNELGYVLLATRRWLMEKEYTSGGEVIINLWKRRVDALLSGRGLEEASIFDDLMQAAYDIGIKLHIEGELSPTKRVENLILKATIEALNNAIRHADAKNLFVKIDDNEDEYIIELTNDGEIPKEKLVEGGGLSSLRKQVEDQFGIMEIKVNPEFKLMIKIPKNMEVETYD